MPDSFVVLTSLLSETDGLPTEWVEAGERGNEPGAVKFASTLRRNDVATRILANNSHDLFQLRTERAAAANAPSTLYGVVRLDPLSGGQTILEWCLTRAAADEMVERLSPILNVAIVTATASGPRG